MRWPKSAGQIYYRDNEIGRFQWPKRIHILAKITMRDSNDDDDDDDDVGMMQERIIEG
jgi:hypothetical protein